METDHLVEAALCLRHALHDDADVGRISRFDVERALEHVEAFQRKLADERMLLHPRDMIGG